MKRRRFLSNTAAAAISPMLQPTLEAAQQPNVVLIVADDLGYGDLGSYGSQISTPNLDRMARDGVVFTHFYAPNPVCSPSRAGFLTGRYGVRGGVPGVLGPTDPGGLAKSETTIAQML